MTKQLTLQEAVEFVKSAGIEVNEDFDINKYLNDPHGIAGFIAYIYGEYRWKIYDYLNKNNIYGFRYVTEFTGPHVVPGSRLDFYLWEDPDKGLVLVTAKMENQHHCFDSLETLKELLVTNSIVPEGFFNE